MSSSSSKWGSDLQRLFRSCVNVITFPQVLYWPHLLTHMRKQGNMREHSISSIWVIPCRISIKESGMLPGSASFAWSYQCIPFYSVNNQRKSQNGNQAQQTNHTYLTMTSVFRSGPVRSFGSISKRLRLQLVLLVLLYISLGPRPDCISFINCSLYRLWTG